FVVAVLERAGYKRPIFVGHILHTERDRGVIEPPFPVFAAPLRSGDRQNVLLLAILHLHVLTAILGEARHFSRCRRRQVKRVVQDQVERGPLAYLTIITLQDVVVILSNPATHRATTQALHPRVSRTVVEQTEVSSISRQGAGETECGRQKLARDANPLCIRRSLKLRRGWA